MTPNEAATVPTVAEILYDFRSTTDPEHSRTTSFNSSATCVFAETPIETASSTSTWNTPPTLCNRVAERSGPDSTNEGSVERSRCDTYRAIPATGAAADKHKPTLPSLMASNDADERRAAAVSSTEAV